VKSPVEDYLAEAEALRPFYRWPPVGADPELIARERRFPAENRKALVSALRRQYEPLPARKSVRAAMAALEDKTTFCVTTGHQPVLFGGPLYVLYKAIGAIKRAREWEKLLPGRKVVPVFWVASEDHDVAEVNHTYLSYDHRVVYPGPLWGAVGRNRIVPTGMQAPAHARRFYLPGTGWSEAFRAWLDKLLGPYGLLTLDGDDPELKRLFFPVVVEELSRGTGARAAQETTRRLAALGYAPQAKIRNPNLFFIDDAGRYRLERDGQHFTLKGTDLRIAYDELIVKPPVFFSPNVVLRPVYQEIVLPSLAYVGGPGELAYWLQLKETFAVFDVPFPALIRRPGATVFGPRDARKLDELGFTLHDLLRSENELRRLCARQLWRPETYRPYFDHLLQTLDHLHVATRLLSPSQAHNVAGQKRKLQRFFERLVLNTDKELLNRYPQTYKPLLRLKRRVQPDGFVQERTLNLAAIPLPPKDFVAFLMEKLDIDNPNNLLPLPENHQCEV
jgi:uncharacterized protein YllA (UPF0747 family)